MKWNFSNKKLEKLYTTGKNNKYKLPKDIIEHFVWLVDIIDAAKNIYDFWNQPALNFEKLEGYENRYSFRINKRYRLEVAMEWENDEHTIGIVGIDEISKHYQ